MPKQYSAKLKIQIVKELIQGEKTVDEVAKAYNVHPNLASAWRRQFMEKGPKVFTEDNTIQEYEKRIAELEQLLGKKELEIALLKTTSWARAHEYRRESQAGRNG
jgi:transposase-like protein